MLDTQTGGQTDAPVAQPGIDGTAALIEGHRLAGLIAESGHRHGMQVLLFEGMADAAHVQVLVKQMTQRRTVEQGHRYRRSKTEQTVTDEAAGLANHPRPVAAQYLLAAKALPEAGQAPDRIGKVRRTAGQGHRVDGTRGGTDDHRKRIGRTRRQQIGNPGQHANLVGSAGATAGEDQAGDRFCCHGFLPPIVSPLSPARPAPTGSGLARPCGSWLASDSLNAVFRRAWAPPGAAT
ncbi:hypothetical protein D3C80_1130030 [compost metagenome]